MLAVISPAKTLDLTSPLPTRNHTEPRLVGESAQLIEVLRKKSPAEIASLMHISDDLAHLNAARYQDFDPEHTPDNSRPAVLTFAGDVYQGLAAPSFTTRDFTEAQKSLRILSGLYGLLRPLDLIQPHRLEMGTKLATARGRNLHDWWGSTVTDLLAEDLAASPGAKVLVNLASQEYFGAVDPDRLGVRVISPRFEDRGRDGVPRVVSFHAKRARGQMAAWLIRNRVRTVAALCDFAEDGYTLDAARSTPEVPIFVR
ncbi:MAG: peroxide stress protein YaaA [Propionibacteriaceae bacterium]|nr:peroxide stress protein YaaA [Propionibacteriaceae bacterium]